MNIFHPKSHLSFRDRIYILSPFSFSHSLSLSRFSLPLSLTHPFETQWKHCTTLPFWQHCDSGPPGIASKELTSTLQDKEIMQRKREAVVTGLFLWLWIMTQRERVKRCLFVFVWVCVCVLNRLRSWLLSCTASCDLSKTGLWVIRRYN